MNPSFQSIDEATAYINERIQGSLDRALEVATALFTAKSLFISTLDWLDWADHNFGFSRRYAFEQARLGWWFGALPKPALDRVRHVALDINKLSTLSRLDPAIAVHFLKKHDVSKLTRDQLRSAVAEFIGLDPQPRVLASARLPKVEQLLLGLDLPQARNAIDPFAEAQFLFAHGRRLAVVADTLPDEHLDAIDRQLEDLRRMVQRRRLRIPDQ